MSIIANFPPAPSWLDGATEISEIAPSAIDPGLRTYERFTAEIPRSGWLTGPDDSLGPHSDVTVGIGRTDSDQGCVIGEGVFVQLRGDESIYFDAETARKAAAALLKAADALEGVTK